MKSSVPDRILQSLEEFTTALEKGEKIEDKFTCRKLVFSLETKHYDSTAVKAIRDLLKASQNVFASFLGVSVKTVQAWEQGVTKPGKMACRFMDEIRAKPSYWKKRFMESCTPM